MKQFRGLSPVICFIAFLAGSACNEKAEPPVVSSSPLADSADQVMFNARFNLTDRGIERAQLASDRAYFFDENTRVELEKVKTTFFTTSGSKDAVLTARKGTYSTRFGNMIARGKVIVVSEDGRELTTEELKYDQGMNEISSDSAFVMTEPGRRLAGIGFRSDPNMRNVRVLKGASGFSRGGSEMSGGAPAAAAGSTPAVGTAPPVVKQ